LGAEVRPLNRSLDASLDPDKSKAQLQVVVPRVVRARVCVLKLNESRLGNFEWLPVLNLGQMV
jgi:hypothetical protein